MIGPYRISDKKIETYIFGSSPTIEQIPKKNQGEAFKIKKRLSMNVQTLLDNLFFLLTFKQYYE